MALFIQHEDIQNPTNGVAIFGPFEESEIQAVLNGPIADMFADSGNVDCVELSDEAASKIYINSRQYWFDLNKEL